jgi:hypothetical protein
VRKSSREENSNPRHGSSLKNSGLNPISANSFACLRRPWWTAWGSVYQPLFQAGSDVMASFKLSVNTIS